MSGRKKITRQRAHTTHGWGSMKKHRGAGNRGGVGNAGSGKRGDAKKPCIWKNKKYFGINGFTSKSRTNIKVINISDVWKYAKGNDINLTEVGINKLLGSGKITQAYNIIVEYATEKAIKKIEEAKGKVSVTVSQEQDSEEQTVEA